MIEKLQYALIHDEEQRAAWIANVACAVMDEVPEIPYEVRQKIGERMVRFICAGHPDDKMTQLMEEMYGDSASRQQCRH